MSLVFILLFSKAMAHFNISGSIVSLTWFWYIFSLLSYKLVHGISLELIRKRTSECFFFFSIALGEHVLLDIMALNSWGHFGLSVFSLVCVCVRGGHLFLRFLRGSSAPLCLPLFQRQEALNGARTCLSLSALSVTASCAVWHLFFVFFLLFWRSPFSSSSCVFFPASKVCLFFCPYMDQLTGLVLCNQELLMIQLQL